MKNSKQKTIFTLGRKTIANLSNTNLQKIMGGNLPVPITSLYRCVNSRRNCAPTYDNCTLICTVDTF